MPNISIVNILFTDVKITIFKKTCYGIVNTFS